MRISTTALFAAAFIIPMWAGAQTRYDQTEPEYGTQTQNPLGPSVGLQVGVGTLHYDRDLSSELNYGVGYSATVNISPQRNVGIELQYAGGVNDVNSALTPNNGRLITNQVGGDIRLNLVPPTYDLPAHLTPFIFGGVAYNRIDTENFTPGISDNINGVAVPAGAGVEVNLADRFMVGARFTYNFLFDEQNDFAGRNTDSWMLGLNLGTRFSG